MLEPHSIGRNASAGHLEYKSVMDIETLRYPVGQFDAAMTFTSETRKAAIDRIAALPGELRAVVRALNDRQIDTPYRPDGWTVRQVVHHVADSHMNGLTRTKLALTERNPTIKPYDENAWALLGDVRLPIDVSLAIIDGVHARWAEVFRSMDDTQFARTLVHPERGVTMTLDFQVHDYAWHSSHHLAHVARLREREGW
jgi:hypothetical protein